MQPDAPKPAKHSTHAVPKLAAQTAPHAKRAPPHAIFLKTEQPEGLIAATMWPTCGFRTMTGNWTGILMTFLLVLMKAPNTTIATDYPRRVQERGAPMLTGMMSLTSTVNRNNRLAMLVLFGLKNDSSTS